MKEMRIGRGISARGGTPALRRALLALVAVAGFASGVGAQQAPAPAVDALPPPEACAVPPRLLPQGAALHHTRSSWKRGEPLVVVAIGSGSTVGSADGKFAAFPHFLSAALTAKLPGREVRIVAQGRQGDTAETMVGHFRSNVLPEKPSLVIWQTGTVEAARGLDADSFAATLDEGIALLTANKMDVLLVNPQYASRMELLINYDPYLSAMENAALQTDATLFDRFHIMHRWVTRGVFDLNSGNREQRRRKAEQAQACIGELLSGVIAQSLQ